MPSGYTPIGLSFWDLEADDAGLVDFELLAFESEDALIKPEQLEQRIRDQVEIAAYRFDGKIPFEQLRGMVKRCSVRLCWKMFQGMNIRLHVWP